MLRPLSSPQLEVTFQAWGGYGSTVWQVVEHSHKRDRVTARHALRRVLFAVASEIVFMLAQSEGKS